LGRRSDLLELALINEGTNTIVYRGTAEADTLVNGSQVQFRLPVLPQGTYTAIAYYNNNEIGTMQYTVAPAKAGLKENATWSKPRDYRVFEFEADLSLSTDRLQTMEFRFYNISSDNVPPTTYTFNYENPNLPYINYVAMQNGAGSLRLSELTDNDIT